MGDGERICRLCLEKCDLNFKAIEKSTRVILNVLLIRKNLAVTEEPMMCTSCAEMLEKCFDFKANCLRNTLKDPYLYKRTNDFSDDHVCRFCRGQLNNCSFIVLNIKEDDAKEKVMLEKCLPELDLNTTKELVICATCEESLHCYSDFITNCEFVEEKIENYLKAAGINGGRLIILNNVRQFVSGSMCEEKDSKVDVMKIKDTQFASKSVDCNEINIVKMEDAISNEKENETDCKPEILLDVEIRACNNVTDDADMLTWKEDGIKDELKLEEKFHVDGEGENDLTAVVEVKDETLLPNDEKIDMKRDQQETHSEARVQIVIGHSHVRVFVCSVCPFRSSAKYIVLVHIVDNHKDEATKRGLPPAVYITPGKDPSSVLYKCVDCPYTTNIKSRFNMHLGCHDDIAGWDNVRKLHKCNHCDYQSKHLKYLKKHYRNVHTPPVQVNKCDKCPFQTRYKKSLRLHMAIHDDIRKAYKCGLCSVETRCVYTLKRHQLTHKSDEEARIYQCELCPYKAKRRWDLKHHALTHKRSEEVPIFKCDSCSYETKFKNHLTRHCLTHQAPKVHPCNLCDYEGKTTRHLKCHFYKAHRNSNERKMHKCKECPYQSRFSSTFQRHILRHKPSEERASFPCDSCCFQFNSKQGLKLHCDNMHKNSDVNIFTCAQCGVQTQSGEALKRHTNKHDKGENDSEQGVDQPRHKLSKPQFQSKGCPREKHTFEKSRYPPTLSVSELQDDLTQSINNKYNRILKNDLKTCTS